MLDLIGLILPPFIDYINKHIESSKVRFVISMLVCAVVAAVVNLDKLKVGNVSDFLASAAIVFTEAQIVYKMLYEKSSLQDKIREE